MEKTIKNEREERLEKLSALKASGYEPFPAQSVRTHTVAALLGAFGELTENKTAVTVNGRIRLKRSHGNLTFCQIEDQSGIIQVALSKKEIGERLYKDLDKLVDVGDIMEMTGVCFVTQKGEQSIMASNWQMLSKAIRPLPDKWHGLKDDEERLRKRYLDMIFHPEVKEMIFKRAKFWQAIRKFLLDRGFIEVETPVLEVTTGGADARPFVTHHNALDMDVYLRISMGELWQKRLLVGGLEKTFEIGRQFRNEGMDAEHLQDYAQMEFYWAYADYEAGMALVKELYRYAAQEAFGTLQFEINGHNVDLGKEWERYDYQKTVKKFTGIDILSADIKEIESKLKELGVPYDAKGWNMTRAIDNLWKYCRKKISGPGFLVGVPLAVSPLAKKLPDRPELTQRFQTIIAGSELGNGYSELNDPVDQAERFAGQQKLREAGDDEAQMFDQEFVEALEYGMPPACGFGMSERVFSFLMGKSARECQIFPLVKPRVAAAQITDNRKQITRTNHNELGIDYIQAVKLVEEYIKDPITKAHLLETEAIMRGLAGHFGEDEEEWGIVGLLHDIDWDLTKKDIKNHTVKAVDILRSAGASEHLISSVVSHTYGNKVCGEHPDKERSTRLEYSLVAAETLTGLIAASAMVQPDKKLASVKPESLKKKFKQKAFAANCDRELIMECEKAGIGVDDFLVLGLKAMQGISDKIGL